MSVFPCSSCTDSGSSAYFGHIDCLRAFHKENKIDIRFSHPSVLSMRSYSVDIAFQQGHFKCACFLIKKGYKSAGWYDEYWKKKIYLVLDNPWWRNYLFGIDYKSSWDTHFIIERKKQEIDVCKNVTMDLVHKNKVSRDIVKHIIHAYL